MSTTPHNQFEYESEQASAYDAARSSDQKWQAEHDVVAAFLTRAAPKRASILDVPVGTGRFFDLYAHGEHSLLGIDVSSAMLAEASIKRDGFPGLDATLTLGDITALDLDAGAVDVSVCIRLLNLIEISVVEQALTELARVTRRHLIVGIRSHGRRGRVRRFARSARAAVKRQPEKLCIHPHTAVDRLFGSIGATTLDRRLIATGAHNSSEYFVYLLALSP